MSAAGATKGALDGVRLGRSALFALGLTVAAGGVAGCEMSMAVYGAPAPMDGATSDVSPNQEGGAPGDATDPDTGGPVARYGAPPAPSFDA